MPPVVVANRQDTVWGNRPVITADLSVIANGNTWKTGLQRVAFFQVTGSAAAAGTQIGGTAAGGTITFAVETGTLAGKALVVGG